MSLFGGPMRRQQRAATRLDGPRARSVAVALVACGLLCTDLPAQEESPGKVCGDATAYSSKLSAAERKRRREEAKADARTDLAWRAMSGAFAPKQSTAARLAGHRPTSPAVEAAFASLRQRYDVDQRLSGGNYEFMGNKAHGTVFYCVPRGLFNDVRGTLGQERESSLRELRGRFSDLERLIADQELETASKLLTELEIDVVNEAQEQALYSSVRDGRERAFFVWLTEWSDVVEKGPEFAEYMTLRAEELMGHGYLTEADRYLQEAIESDRQDRRARQLRQEIYERRVQRAELLTEAEELASKGRFAAAQNRLDQAEALDHEDTQPLLDTIRQVDGLRAEYLQYNPKRAVMIFTAAGTLGADTDAIADRVAADTGLSVSATAPLNFGVGADFRYGRHVTVSVTGSLGAADASSGEFLRISPTLYTTIQLTAGVGLRMPRSATRSYAIKLSGGLSWESISLPYDTASGRSTSDSQDGLFVRLGLDYKGGTFFVQQGLGFEDSPDGLIAWSNQMLIGGGWVF